MRKSGKVKAESGKEEEVTEWQGYRVTSGRVAEGQRKYEG